MTGALDRSVEGGPTYLNNCYYDPTLAAFTTGDSLVADHAVRERGGLGANRDRPATAPLPRCVHKGSDRPGPAHRPVL